MSRINYIDLAIDLYRNYGSNLPHEAKRLIGGPFSLTQIVQITGVPARYLRSDYVEHARPGGRFNPESLKDMGQLRYLLDLGADLDKGLVWRVVLGGTSERVLAQVLGVFTRDIRTVLKEDYAPSFYGHGDPQRGNSVG